MNQEIAEINKIFDKNVNVIKGLVNRIGDLPKITLEQRNFFLFNEGNCKNHTFYTELNKKKKIISTDGIGLKATELISPANNLKFNVLEKKHKEKVVLQLKDIRSKQKIDVKDKKRTNFSILSTTQKNRVGVKRKMTSKIINEIKIGGMQSFEKYDKLNPVEVSVKDSEVNTFLSRFKRYKYRLIINNLLLSSSLTKDTNGYL